MENRGSEWNVWDLHIHTPASFHWEGGNSFQDMTSKEANIFCQKIINQINSSEPIAFSIVDYFTFDGILRIKKFLNENSNNSLQKTLFPGIELRLETPTDFRTNVQVIFSEKITDQELKDFKADLKILGSDRSLSKEAIIEIARNLTPDKAKECIGNKDYKENNDVAYELGCKTITITRDSFKIATEKRKDKCLIIFPYETFNGLAKLNWKKHPIEDMYYLGLTDFFESRKPEYIDLFLGNKTSKNQNFFDNFQQAIGGKAKPVLSGSDTHKIEDYGIFPNGKKTWLKAEPTFEGLKQVIIEPRSRCFIGEEPEKLKLVRNNATKFISKVQIEKKQDSNFDEKWFNNTVYFNSELVAIIGNKGSGKSALSDIIGLLGNSKQHHSFSFLNSEKFRIKGDKSKAKNFKATLFWESKDKEESCLNRSILPEEIEKVKYIPQSYLETLCNEINKKYFYTELKSVIFSHISSEKRLDKENLDELLKYKAEEINRECSNLRKELKTTIKKILDYRNQTTDEHKNKIKNELTTKQRELEALENTKPEKVLKPTSDNIDVGMQENIKKIEKLKKEEKMVEQEIISLKNDIESLTKKKAVLDKAKDQINILKQETLKKIKEIQILLESIDYAYDDFMSFDDTKISKLEKESFRLRTEITQKKKKIYGSQEELNSRDSCLEVKKEKIEEKIKNLSEKIDEPNQKYQKYLKEQESWEKKILNIQGDIDTPNTLKYLDLKLKEIQSIPEKITELEKERDDLVEKIYDKISQLAEFYKDYYEPVQKFIKNKPFEKGIFDISFNVSIKDEKFKENFFDLINRNKAGTFHGIENSDKKIQEIFDKYDFNKLEDTIKLVKEIFYCLENDCRSKPPKKHRFELQTKDPEDLYNMIFSLKYLEPKYLLQLNKKNLKLLSPGERGTLLLIFYLMVDKDDRPLILDQPEENLDNQTIYNILVKCIKKAKEKRQIFLVTHNPNLAVVCDAEQIITASIDKINKNTVTYHSGAIENPETNKNIVDILEGTQPAFKNRENKYHNI